VTEDSLRLRMRIDASTDTVFKALTDPDTLTDWFCESASVRADPDEVGDAEYTFWGRYAPQGDRPRQQLIELKPAQTLRFSWELDGASPSTVDVNLAEDEGATVVSVTHTGIADLTALRCFWYVSLANLAAQCEGLPTTPPFDFSVPAQGDALVRTVIDAPVEDVFASLLDPAQVSRWAPGTGPSAITELEPDKALAYSWPNGSWSNPGSPDTTVTWNLRSSRGSTYLTLIHTGFPDDDVAERSRQEWPARLVELKRMLELGERWEPLES
jgi:uncharacterized protein YndB with AHSA1/START domain